MRSASASIATVMGRFYAMDRDNALGARGEGAITPSSAARAIRADRCPSSADRAELMTSDRDRRVRRACRRPTKTAWCKRGRLRHVLQLPPRPRTRDHPHVRRCLISTASPARRAISPSRYVCMTQYDATMPNVTDGVSARSRSTNTLGEYVSAQRHDAAAHRRDGEVRPRHLLLQRRRREHVYEGEDRVPYPVARKSSRPTTSSPR